MTRVGCGARGMRRVSAPTGHGLEEELGQVLLVAHDLLHLLDPLDITNIPAVDTRGAAKRGAALRSGEESRNDGTNISAGHFSRSRASVRNTNTAVPCASGWFFVSRRGRGRGQRVGSRERKRDKMLAGTHNAREHAIRRGHDGAIRRFERRIRRRATRASMASSVSGFFSRARQSKHRASCATSWSPRAPGGQPGTRARLRKHATHAPRRARDAEARARRREKPRVPARRRSTHRLKSSGPRRARARRALASVARRSTSEKSAMKKYRYGGRGVPLVLSMVRAHATCVWKSRAFTLLQRDENARCTAVCATKTKPTLPYGLRVVFSRGPLQKRVA